MLGFLIGLVSRQSAAAAPPPQPDGQPTLLTEAGDHLLLESGGRIILE